MSSIVILDVKMIYLSMIIHNNIVWIEVLKLKSSRIDELLIILFNSWSEIWINNSNDNRVEN